jgi:serine/threonine-protein kinase
MSSFLDNGTVLAGYRLESVLGSGGTGVVYLATKLDLSRPEALKVLAPELRDDLEFRQRLAREWRLAASLEHPNILPVLDAGEADGQAYLAMQYVEGGDLLAEITRYGTLAPERALAIVRQVALALDAAHHAGLVHGDVRPAHVLLGDDDRAYLSGFGLMRGANFLGSYDYAAPEQLEGKPLDGRTDLYALGCVLYHCVAGRPPFAADDEGAVMRAQLLDQPPRPSAANPLVPAAMDEIVARAMAKDPADRYQSAGELVAAIEPVLSPVDEAVGDTLVGVPAMAETPERELVDGGAVVAATRATGTAHAPPPRSRNPIDRLTHGMPRSWRITLDWLVTIVGAILIVLAIKQWVINPYRIPSSSMEPTLHCARPGNECEAGISDRVLACRFCYHLWDPKRGDIIVFNTPPQAAQDCGSGGVFVKRLIGLPGETWEERNGYVYIDGKKLDEPYIKPERRDPDTHGPQKIPAGHYFMMGDNRRSSCDSRRWGTVSHDELIGKVIATYWPPQRLSIK